VSLPGGVSARESDPDRKEPTLSGESVSTDPPPSARTEESVIAGERRESTLNRTRSLQSRVGQTLAVILMGALAVGLLGWYYVHTFNAQGTARKTAQTASRNQASGDAPLPTLGPIDPPKLAATVLGPPPPDPTSSLEASAPQLVASAAGPVPGAPGQPIVKSPAELALERRLLGPAFSRSSDSGLNGPSAPAVPTPTSATSDMTTGPTREPDRVSGVASGNLQELFKPSVTQAARAEVLPTQRLLLPKGAFVDCTLETAIDSTLPGMTTCVTATDTFGADGTTVLLERGTKLVGETRGEVAQGSARVFVLWTEARTPTGVVIPLASPGTDELGRSGLAGNVNRHFFQRFGAAILISIIDGGIQAALTSRSSGGTVIYSPSSSQDVMTEVLKDTINIRPTVTKNQGDRIQILVARDLDFRSVYELKSTQP
jgi:type IV secretion system protein VirB10